MRFFRRETAVDEVTGKMRRMADLFVGAAAKFGVTSFDYSERSIGDLDDWADRLWDPAGPQPGPAELDSSAKTMGAYLGEVIIRNLGGRWVWVEAEGMSQPAVALPGGGNAMVANKAFKRQLNGRDDSFDAFYAAAKEHVATART